MFSQQHCVRFKSSWLIRRGSSGSTVLGLHGPEDKAPQLFVTSVTIYQSARGYIPEDLKVKYVKSFVNRES
jgi:hypothetical protein